MRERGEREGVSESITTLALAEEVEDALVVAQEAHL